MEATRGDLRKRSGMKKEVSEGGEKKERRLQVWTVVFVEKDRLCSKMGIRGSLRRHLATCSVTLNKGCDTFDFFFPPKVTGHGPKIMYQSDMQNLGYVNATNIPRLLIINMLCGVD